MGRDFNDVLKSQNLKDHLYSFDMLGEAARTQEQAEKYFQSYFDASK